MPTNKLDDRFQRDLERLSQEERKQLSRAVNKLVADLKARQGFRKGLRIKGVQGHDGIYGIWDDLGARWPRQLRLWHLTHHWRCAYHLAARGEPRHPARPIKAAGYSAQPQ